MVALKIKFCFWNLSLLLWTHTAKCSIAGINYMDPIKINTIKNKLPPGTDPCNPLYWYPRDIPEFCQFVSTTTPPGSEEPPSSDLSPSPPMLIPMLPPPLPMIPPPVPILPPPVPMLPPPVPMLPPPVPILPLPYPILPPPFSILPLPTSSINGPPPLPAFAQHPSISNPYSFSHLNTVSSPNLISYYQSLTGFVPGIHGLVTKDGGINIMPFSDVYADMLEKHKHKMIRRKLQKILDKYEYNPHLRDYRNLQKYEKYFTDDK